MPPPGKPGLNWNPVKIGLRLFRFSDDLLVLNYFDKLVTGRQLEGENSLFNLMMLSSFLTPLKIFGCKVTTSVVVLNGSESSISWWKMVVVSF